MEKAFIAVMSHIELFYRQLLWQSGLNKKTEEIILKIKLGIMTIVLTVCGILAVYVANTEKLHNNTIAKAGISKKTNSYLNDMQDRRTADPQPPAGISKVSGKNIPATQTGPDDANPSLVDIRRLDIVNKLNQFDGEKKKVEKNEDTHLENKLNIKLGPFVVTWIAAVIL